MVPIYDSDVAEERFSKGEWSHYELWEKVELRLRHKNRLWIAGTVLVFLLLSSVPILIDQRPRWTALSGIRHLSQQISRLKRDAALQHSPLRIRFGKDGDLSYQIEKVAKCGDPTGVSVESGNLLAPEIASQYRLLSHQAGETASIPGLVQEFCYDPLTGSATFSRGESVVGFAVAPANDLTAGRIDRLAVLLLTGPSAELSFE